MTQQIRIHKMRRVLDAANGSHSPPSFPWGPIPPIRGKCPEGTKRVGIAVAVGD